MSNYHEWDAFKDVYLEDSFVLDIHESDKELSIFIEAVLTERHPLYSKPNKNEQYCYKKCKIIFTNCSSINWITKNIIPTTDADGSIDYGNVDRFVLTNDQYELSGDWGEVHIDSPSVDLLCE